MDYVKPVDVVETAVEAGVAKANMTVQQMLIRGFLGGSILAFATTLAFQVAVQTKVSIAGALVFPVGFVMIVLLGMELVTGNFGLIPNAVMEKKTTFGRMIKNYWWVIVGHLLGCICYAILYNAVISKMGTDMVNPLVENIIKVTEAKTTAYKALGFSGLMLVFIKAILCNWMVTIGATIAMTSKSTAGKILAMWLPILTFFAQGFEHLVVNMFVIPSGIMLGANVTIADGLIWNWIPVFFGNLVGGVIFTGFFIYFAHKKKEAAAK